MGDPVDGVAVTVILTTGDSVIVGAPDGSEDSSKQKLHAEAHLSLTT